MGDVYYTTICLLPIRGLIGRHDVDVSEPAEAVTEPALEDAAPGAAPRGVARADAHGTESPAGRRC